MQPTQNTKEFQISGKFLKKTDLLVKGTDSGLTLELRDPQTSWTRPCLWVDQGQRTTASFAALVILVIIETILVYNMLEMCFINSDQLRHTHLFQQPDDHAGFRLKAAGGLALWLWGFSRKRLFQTARRGKWTRILHKKQVRLRTAFRWNQTIAVRRWYRWTRVGRQRERQLILQRRRDRAAAGIYLLLLRTSYMSFWPPLWFRGWSSQREGKEKRVSFRLIWLPDQETTGWNLPGNDH